MLIETTQRVRDGLTELIALVNCADTTTADVRRVLEESKILGAQVSVVQTDAAAVVAARERHGDSGAGVLAQAAGLSKRDAAGRVKTAEKLESMPAVRDAVESGDISLANAKALADASDKTSAEQVEQDSGLLKQAAVLSPERFAREAGRWSAQRQDDGGEGDYRRRRARRRLSIWDGDDGMVHLRGEFDPVSGDKIRKRLFTEAERQRRKDIHSPGGEQRSFHQRMADALDTLTNSGSGGGSARGAGGKSAGGGRLSADIAIVQHLSADGTRAFAEIAGGAPIPQSVLDEHMCNAKITGVVFSGRGVPLWQGHTTHTATPAQRTALIAKYGGCGGCGAHAVLCQVHHIVPVSQGGATDITNMMLLCWGCHQKVHHHGWRVVPRGGLHTIEAPERIRYGPARAPDPPPAVWHRQPPASRRTKAADATADADAGGGAAEGTGAGGGAAGGAGAREGAAEGARSGDAGAEDGPAGQRSLSQLALTM